MTTGKVALVSTRESLGSAIERAFAQLGAGGETDAMLMFDMSWQPTMDVVDLIVRELDRSDTIQTLTLIHPSAAMSVIAAAITSRVQTATFVTSKRSMYDDPEDEETDATESRSVFRMDPQESLEVFVRRSVAEVRARAVHRFALVFDASSHPTIGLADVLVEELVQSGVREIGLIHSTVRLDAIAASVRLRLANVRIALGNERRTL